MRNSPFCICKNRNRSVVQLPMQRSVPCFCTMIVISSYHLLPNIPVCAMPNCSLAYKCLTAKLLQQGYRYHKLRKTFSKFYRRHYKLISKYNVGLKMLLSEGLSEPEFYGDLVYKFKKLKGINDFWRTSTI